MPTRSKMTKVVKPVNWEDVIQEGLDEALKNRKHFTDDSAWARASSRVFYYKLDKKVQFKDIYLYLLGAAEMDVHYESDEESEDSVVESSNSKNKLNGILFKEFHDWYDAFLREENDGDEGAGDADDRWIRHAVKVASKRLKVSEESIQEDVEKWISRRTKEREEYRDRVEYQWFIMY